MTPPPHQYLPEWQHRMAAEAVKLCKGGHPTFRVGRCMESTPIINLFRHDAEALGRYRKWMLCPLPSLTDPDSDPPTVRRTGETSVRYAKRLLGKQDYCKTYLCKCWVWEDVAQGWRLYASRRGLQLEVLLPDGFDWNDEGNLSRATAAFDAFLTRWGK